MTTKEYQNRIDTLLKNKLPELEIENEWVAFRGYHNQYSPRVDIAVGPFSTEPGQNKIEEYNRLVRQSNINSFLRSLYRLHKENVRNLHVENDNNELLDETIIPNFNDVVSKNWNARCFLALEIENKNTRKHVMGSVINAASLGRVGVGIAYSEEILRAFVRILNYLHFLKRVGKNYYDTTNFLIITKEQMLTLLDDMLG
ncbi:MAG: hypothetical protein FWE63_00545 [Bacteroidales bacterium]|nr:hypothetical protein [Bacteroidales bacterium]